jgi:hypothetical protein
MATDLLTQVVTHAQCAHAALDAAHAELTKQASTAAAVKAAIPGVVDALVRHKRIDPHDREKAAAALADPLQLLQIVTLTADPDRTIEPRPLGAPGPTAAPEKQAGDRAYAGERTGRPTAADDAFERAILGPR